MRKIDQSIINLEPPGAGLPPEELKRTQERFHTAFNSNTRADYEELFKYELTTILQILEKIPGQLRGERVLIDRIRGIEDSSRHWSAYMTLEHLHICNVIFLDIIEKLLRGGIEPMTKVLPENVKPGVKSNDASRVAFEQSAQQFLDVVTQVKSLNTEATHPHPWLGPLDGAKWLALSAVHMKIHRQQMELIQAGLQSEQ